MIVVIEGQDCAGKSTQVSWLANKIRLEDPAEVLKFPDYSTPTGGLIKSWLNQKVGLHCLVGENFLGTSVASYLDPLAFQAACLANRVEKIPYIQQFVGVPSTLVIDRYWPSAVAYGFGVDGLDFDYSVSLSAGLPKADLYVLLNVDVDTILARRDERATPDRYETEHWTADRRARAVDCHAAYSKIWLNGVNKMNNLAEDPWYIVVDGNGSPEFVSSSIWELYQDCRRWKGLNYSEV